MKGKWKLNPNTLSSPNPIFDNFVYFHYLNSSPHQIKIWFGVKSCVKSLQKRFSTHPHPKKSALAFKLWHSSTTHSSWNWRKTGIFILWSNFIKESFTQEREKSQLQLASLWTWLGKFIHCKAIFILL